MKANRMNQDKYTVEMDSVEARIILLVVANYQLVEHEKLTHDVHSEVNFLASKFKTLFKPISIEEANTPTLINEVALLDLSHQEIELIIENFEVVFKNEWITNDWHTLISYDRSIAVKIKIYGEFKNMLSN